jgi:hypothetical protein
LHFWCRSNFGLLDVIEITHHINLTGTNHSNIQLLYSYFTYYKTPRKATKVCALITGLDEKVHDITMISTFNETKVTD